MRVDDDDAVELQPLDGLGREQRHVVVAEFVHVVDRDAARRSPSAAAIDSCSAGGATTPVMRWRCSTLATTSAATRAERSLGVAACHAGGSPSARTLRLATASTPVQRQQPVGDVEDRAGHAVADRQVGDLSRRRAEVGEHVLPVAPGRPVWSTGRGRRGSSSSRSGCAGRSPAAPPPNGPAPRRRRRDRT